MNEDVTNKLWTIVEKIPFKSEYLILIQKNKIINPKEVFKIEYKKYFLELGSGWGEVGVELAKKNPDTGFILMEKNRGRLQYTAKEIFKHKLENIKLICCNFNWFLKEIYPQNSFDTILLNFPDPWPKIKHWQNRTINHEFINSIYYLLNEKGKFNFATDHGGYGRKAISYFRKNSIFQYNEEFTFERKDFPISVFENEKRLENKKIYYIERFK